MMQRKLNNCSDKMTLESLPPEIKIRIFQLLPMRDVYTRAVYVCKSWADHDHIKSSAISETFELAVRFEKYQHGYLESKVIITGENIVGMGVTTYLNQQVLLFGSQRGCLSFYSAADKNFALIDKFFLDDDLLLRSLAVSRRGDLLVSYSRNHEHESGVVKHDQWPKMMPDKSFDRGHENSDEHEEDGDEEHERGNVEGNQWPRIVPVKNIEDNDIAILNVSSRNVGHCSASDDTFYLVDNSPKSITVISNSDDGYLARKEEFTCSEVYSLTVSDNGEKLFVLNKNGTIDVVNIHNLSIEHTLFKDKDYCLDFGLGRVIPCDQLYANVYSHDRIRYLSKVDFKHIRSMQIPSPEYGIGQGHSIAVSKESNMLFFAIGGMIRVYSTVDYNLQHTIQLGKTSIIMSLIFLSESMSLIVQQYDGTVRAF